jgi:hypothetical protein
MVDYNADRNSKQCLRPGTIDVLKYVFGIHLANPGQMIVSKQGVGTINP